MVDGYMKDVDVSFDHSSKNTPVLSPADLPLIKGQFFLLFPGDHQL
nr:hypothetical protein Iba_chr09cCG1880 [Ipomoea batatas]